LAFARFLRYEKASTFWGLWEQREGKAGEVLGGMYPCYRGLLPREGFPPKKSSLAAAKLFLTKVWSEQTLSGCSLSRGVVPELKSFI